MFSSELIRQIIAETDANRAAQIQDVVVNNYSDIQVYTIPLDTAKTFADPFIIGYAFKTLWLKNATDNTTEVSVRFNDKDRVNSEVPLRNNDVVESESLFGSAYLSWSAQPGKTITLIVGVRTSFKSGALINSGTLNLAVPATATGPTRVTLAAATAAVVVAADPATKNAIVQNHTGAPAWYGPSSSVSNTGANQGIEVPDKGILLWSNQTALYGYSVAGGDVTIVKET